MSRVYDTPRYEDQVLNKVLLHLDVYRMTGPITDLRYRFGNQRVLHKTFDEVKYELQQLELLDADEHLKLSPDETEEAELYHHYFVADSIARPGYDQLSRTTATGEIIHKILLKHSGLPVWCDFDASIRIMHGYLSGKYAGNLSVKDDNIQRISDSLARDASILSIATCRMGNSAKDMVIRDIVPGSCASASWRRMIYWNRGMELIRLKSMTPEVIQAHELLRMGNAIMPVEDFSVAATKAVKTVGAKDMYRIMGLYIIIYEDAIYVIDFSALDQIHQVSKMWEGFYKYASNYRICGQNGNPREINPGVIDKCANWVVKTLEHTGFTDALPRSMKQSLALMQNDMHASAERLDVNLETKSRKLNTMIREILVLDEYWHEFLRSLNISCRSQLDIAHVFYAIPAPDCNLKYLFERASVYMQQGNTTNSFEFHDFMNYCMALDLCKALALYKKEVKYKTIDGYDPSERSWFKDCVRGILKLPPDEEMGHAWVEGFFPFNDTLPQWYWEAADVTHVTSNKDAYENLHAYQEQPKDAHNELLYALNYAPLLSNKWTPKDIMDKLGTGKDTWDRMAVMAVKCENTKPGKKCRETWSADDITRELTTCYDRAAIPIAAMYKGVTARKSDIEVQAIFDKICAFTRKDNKKKAIIMSNDVSGWSPLGDREAWSRHHDYLIRMTKAPDRLRLKDVWRGIVAYLAKRGFLASVDLKKGLFQGWTGTCDSIFNVHISLYCVRKAKRAGLLLKSEGASTAGLIDDAVQAVELDPESSLEHQQKAADSHFATTAETWSALGAELDVVKTLYSSCKFIYLNRFFCEGSEVVIPMKIFARADKEFNRRFAPVFSQLDTVLGSYRSAAEKGACPIASYYFAVTRCIQLCFYSNSSLIKAPTLSVLNALFAPRGLGGWGLPHMAAWLTQENPDSLTCYTYVMTTAIDCASDDFISQELNKLLEGTLDQELEIVSIQSILSSPTTVYAAGVPKPDADVLRKLKLGMMKKCKSDVFRAALSAGESHEVLEGLSRIVKSARWDASILELLGQCLPSSCSSALIDRAYKNELVTQLFPYRVRSEMSSIIRKGSAAAVSFLVDKSQTFQRPDVLHSRSTAYDLAFHLRCRFYDKNQLEVANHTLPDYASCLARQYPGPNPGIVVSCTWPKGSCATEEATTANMYDGIPPKERSKVPRSQTVYTFTGERFRYMTPVQRCISKAAIVSAYLTSFGAHGKLFWDITMALWGASHAVSAPVVTTSIKIGTSTKRLSAAVSHLTHAIAAFRNTHGCVEINADPLGKYLDVKKTHVDYMSFVTAARFVGLMNMATNRAEITQEDLHFGFSQGSLPLTEEDKLTVFDEGQIDASLRYICEVSNKDLFPQVLSSMLKVEYARGPGEEYVCIGFTAEHMGAARMGHEVSIAAGYLSNIIHCGVISATATRKRTSMVHLAGDEILARPTMKADTRMRNLLRICSRSQAAVCLAMETLRDLCPGGVKMNIALAPWKAVSEEFRLTFPKWSEYWTNVVSLMRRFTPSVDENVARALLGKVPHLVIAHLRYLDERCGEPALVVLAYLYLSSYGRLRTPESYTLTSALGVQHMARCWGLAHKVRSTVSRKWRQQVSRERTLMGMVYLNLSLAAQNFYSKLQVLRAIPVGVKAYVQRYHHEHEYPEIEMDNRFLTAEPSQNPYWKYLLKEIIKPLRPLKLNTQLLERQLMEVAQDIFVLGDVQLLGPAVGAEVYLPAAQVPSMEGIPILHELEMDFAEAGDIVVEEDEDVDPRLQAAVAAYLDMGIETAMQVYNGEIEYSTDIVHEQDEISEFLEAMRDWSTPADGAQDADET